MFHIENVEDIEKQELLPVRDPIFTDKRGRKLEDQDQEIKVFSNLRTVDKFKIQEQELGFSVSKACELTRIDINPNKIILTVQTL